MGTAGPIHPTDRMLQSYGLGTLDDASADSVSKHLASCSDCQSRLAEISSDSFLGRLRDAGVKPGAPVAAPVVSSLAGLSMLDSGATATSPPAAETLPPGLAEHPDYEVIRELGQGGMGAVYLAKNRLLGRYEVLKVVSTHLIKRRGVLDRFLGEIRNAARLHHTNIVTAYSASRLGEGIVFAMEYVEGLDLAKLVKSKGALPVANACNYIHQTALGLQHAHEQGMVHRDIKPSNLMLARQGSRAIIKVLDFGLAKIKSEGAPDSGLTHEGQMLGTPDYIAPEQIRNAREADIRADIYSLGCTLYCLLTGGPPFQATSLYELLQAHHSMEAMPLNLARPEVPVELAALVAHMMAKEPERRCQEPKDVAQAIKPFFKLKGVGQSISKSESSRDERALSAPPQSVAPLRPVSKPPAEPVYSATPLEIMAELLDTEHAAPVVVPVLAPMTRRRDLRSNWPTLAAVVALGVISLALIFHVATRPSSSEGNGRAEELAVEIPSPAAETQAIAPAIQQSVPPRVRSSATYALRFDPERKSLVRISNIKCDGSRPITLETYVRPLAPPADIVGHIISNHEGSGVALVVWPSGHVALQAHAAGEYRTIDSRRSVMGERVHLAGVLSGRHLALFVDGQEQDALDLEGPLDASLLPFFLGGNPNRDGSADQNFNGIVEEVRISKSARYHGDFTPAERLEVDDDTALLYRFDRNTSDVAVDASGHGNDGMIVGAEPMLLIDAPRMRRTPVADGRIGSGEYGMPMKVDYTSIRNPGRLIVLNRDGRDASDTVDPRDLSFELYSAHTASSLFLAFRISDDFIDDEPEENGRVFFNDCVELFIDGDRVPDDFVLSGEPRRASREGFQIASDALGRQMTYCDDFSNNDWKVATSRLADGYILEFEIPLALIDTANGAEFAAAKTGSLIWFNAAVNDNDSAVHRQEDCGPLWLVGPPEIKSSPAIGGEQSWRVGLSLSGRPAERQTGSSAPGHIGAAASLVTVSVPKKAADRNPSQVRPSATRYDQGPGRRLLKNGPARSVTSLAISRDGSTLVSGHDGSVRSWNLYANRERFHATTSRQVSRIDMTPDGATVVSVEHRHLGEGRTVDDHVVVRDGRTGAVRHEMKVPATGVYSVAVSGNGSIVVSSCWGENIVRVWDAAKGRQIRALTGHTGSVYDVAFRPDGTIVGSASVDTTVRLWNVDTGTVMNIFKGHRKSVQTVVFSPDGTKIASGSYDHTARVWDVATGRQLAVLEHDHPVLCLAFSPDSKTLATASASWADIQFKVAPAQVRLWDVAQGSPRMRLPEQPIQVFDLAFTPDGTTLISANMAGAIIFWDLSKFDRSSSGN
jgi:serine/threonine protein kinase